MPEGRVKGRTIKWVSKSRGREQLSIEWKLGIRDDGYVPGPSDRSHMMHQKVPGPSDLCKVFTLKGKFLSDPKFGFTLDTQMAHQLLIFSQRK